MLELDTIRKSDEQSEKTKVKRSPVPAARDPGNEEDPFRFISGAYSFVSIGLPFSEGELTSLHFLPVNLLLDVEPESLSVRTSDAVSNGPGVDNSLIFRWILDFGPG